MKGVFSTELQEIEQMIIKSKYQESLKRLNNLQKRKELLDEEIIQIKILKTRIFIDIQPFSKALENAKQAYVESLKLNNNFLIFDSARLYAQTLNYLGFVDSAVEKVNHAKNVFENIKEQETVEYLKRKAIGLQFKLGKDNETYLKNLKQSFSILEEIGDEYEKAWLLMTLQGTCHTMGKDIQADKYLNEGMKLFVKIGNKVGHAWSITLLSAYLMHRGEFDSALTFSLKALSLAEEVDSSFLLGGIYADLGFYYWQKGELETSLQYYNRSIFQIKRGKHIGYIHYPAINLRMILVYLEQGKIEKAKQHLEKIEIIATLRSLQDESDQKYTYMSIYKLAQSIILKSISFEENQDRIEQMLKDVIQEEGFYIEMNRLALFHLCDLYLRKLKESNDLEIMNPLRDTINKLDKIAEIQRSSILLAETYLLKSHLALVELRIEDAKILLEKAQKIADEKSVTRLATLISNEYDYLLEQISGWESFTAKLPNIADRMELTHIEEMMDNLVKNRISFADVSQENEDPGLFIIMDVTGHVVFSDNFEGFQLDSKTSQDIISSIHDFLNENKLLEGVLQRLRYKNFSFLLFQSEDLIISYVFMGKSYSAMQKIKTLIHDFGTFSEVWKAIRLKVKTKQELDLEVRTKLSDYLESIFI